MAVSTIASALGTFKPVRDPNGVDNTSPVISFLQGNRTAEQMIGEYFGLRKEKVMSDDGQEVIDMINEFRDPVALKQKKVKYVQYFADKGMTLEMFHKVVPREYLTLNEDANEQPNNSSVESVEAEPELPSVNKRARRAKK